MTYIQGVMPGTLYDEIHQTIKPPPEEKIRQVNEILNTPYLVHKKFHIYIYSIINFILTNNSDHKKITQLPFN